MGTCNATHPGFHPPSLLGVRCLWLKDCIALLSPAQPLLLVTGSHSVRCSFRDRSVATPVTQIWAQLLSLIVLPRVHHFQKANSCSQLCHWPSRAVQMKDRLLTHSELEPWCLRFWRDNPIVCGVCMSPLSLGGRVLGTKFFVIMPLVVDL